MIYRARFKNKQEIDAFRAALDKAEAALNPDSRYESYVAIDLNPHRADYVMEHKDCSIRVGYVDGGIISAESQVFYR